MLRRTGSLLLAVGVLLVLCASASAFVPAPGWELTTTSYPTVLPPEGKGLIRIDVFDTGAVASAAGATLTDTLPAHLTAVSGEGWECSGSGPETCSWSLPSQGAGVTEKPHYLAVSVQPGAAASEVNRVTVAGGGAAAAASAADAIAVNATPVGFGVAGFDGWFSNADGTPDTLAGSHPYEATFVIALNVNAAANGGNQPAGNAVREIAVGLPPGLVADPNAAPQCTRAQFDHPGTPQCPAASQIGTLTAGLLSSSTPTEPDFPVYNLVPPPGLPAQFGFTFLKVNTFIDGSVRTGGDYSIVGAGENIVQRNIAHVTVTLWGVPSEASHTPQRCILVPGSIKGTFSNKCGVESNALPAPFLTMPTSCGEALTSALHIRAWQLPGAASEEANASFASHDLNGTPPLNNTPLEMTGCEGLQFAPSIEAAPDTSYADTPAGLSVNVKVPQEGLTAPEGLSTADIKNTTVALPEGLAINPGQAAGLKACGPNEDGLTTQAEKQAGEEDTGPPSCPPASKVGEVRIKTPLLESAAERELVGDVYVMQSNPPNLELLVAASADGVNIKLVGDVHLCESAGELIEGSSAPATRTCQAPGQLITTFTETPQLPFTEFKLSFSGGAQAALATPTVCGTYATSADFTPWSTPLTEDTLDSNSFQIANGTDGAPCPSLPLGFAPTLNAGATTDQAGGFTDFSLLLQSPDDQQRIQRLQFKAPEGLLGEIAKVTPCTEAQAQADACLESAQIGHTVVASGPGPYPLVVPQPGQPPAPIYLTESYGGAPFGLLIKVPLLVGPFELQTQVVRAKIEVDPHTAQITVTTNPLPQVVDGVPTDLRTVDALIDKPGFMINPTNCEPQEFTGTAYGTPPPGVGGPGATAAISSHFQMGSCQALTFKPDFKVSVSGKTSRANGESLAASIVYPTTPLGANQASSQSNIRSVKVDLPKQLPSRLTTLQKACPEKTFEANPAGCPADSRVGQVKVITPLLPVALEGPAYFVSHGGAKFPELIFVIEGDGVTIYVNGETFISPSGITSDTLRTVPDAPISSFTLTFPEGPFSALAANGNLCKDKLVMPTAFTAQNGAVIHENTPIGVTSCPKAKKGKKAKHKKVKHSKKKK
jgi:hypothetical protein